MNDTTHESAGDSSAALEAYTRAVELDPQFALAWFCRGDLWRGKGEPELAFADYTSAIEANPTFKLAYLHRADAYQQTGDLALAANDLRTLECLRGPQQG